jgi:hypothetical protein
LVSSELAAQLESAGWQLGRLANDDVSEERLTE